MTSGFLSKGLFGGLAFRVLLFLSLALLPIGLIAVMQTRQIADQSQQTAELSLIAMTEQAAQTERTILQEAVGAGRALVSVVKLVRDDPVRCSDFFRTYQKEISNYRLVGFIEQDGSMTCSSNGKSYELGDSPIFQKAMAEGSRTVTGLDRGRISQEAVVVVTRVVFDGETPLGIIFISIDRATMEGSELSDTQTAPLSLITFNAAGEIVTSELERVAAEAELPAAYDLKQLTANKRQVFTSNNVSGVSRVYAITPMLEGAVFAMSVWPTDTPLLKTEFSNRVSTLLPIVMWVASLIVAFWALNRLAITHIRRLGRQMRHFALNRTLPRKPFGDRVPVEIVAMEQSFLGMAKSILQDEARQEDSLREKNMLLKEVHHRVKNNLQLISSIMNMQIRQAPTDANRKVLQRLQDRILSLATVHKSLYQDNEMSRVDAGILLRDIVSNSLAVGLEPNSGIEVTEGYESIFVGPDDAAPLSLLVSEAITNALKYVSSSRKKGGHISISLKYTGEENALLRIENTAGDAPQEAGTGLGSKLILAFARQLNGTLETTEEQGLYVLSLAFPVPLKDKEAYDY